LILFFPPAQIFLSTAVHDLTMAVTLPFGVASDAEVGLRNLLGNDRPSS
jgi:hypothetical protein